MFTAAAGLIHPGIDAPSIGRDHDITDAGKLWLSYSSKRP
jgi:hypothetical protein